MTATRAWFAIIAVLVATSGAAEDMAEKRGSGVSLEHGPDLAMCAPDGIAVGGYDVLSYRSDGGPRQGDPEFAADHEGKSYVFVSADNRDRFLADPARYVPAYNGFLRNYAVVRPRHVPGIHQLQDRRRPPAVVRSYGLH